MELEKVVLDFASVTGSPSCRSKENSTRVGLSAGTTVLGTVRFSMLTAHRSVRTSGIPSTKSIPPSSVRSPSAGSTARMTLPEAGRTISASPSVRGTSTRFVTVSKRQTSRPKSTVSVFSSP